MKFKRKPNIIEAVKWTGDGDSYMNVVAAFDCRASTSYDGKYLYVETLEGTMRADPFDYIVKGIKGEIYVCKPDIFDANHESIE